MTKTKKRSLILCLFALFFTALSTLFITVASTAKADEVETDMYEALTFTLINDDSEYEVKLNSNYAGPKNLIMIPSEYNNLPVTSVATSAFYQCLTLQHVSIPDSVTSIGACAFYDCSNLEDVILSKNITSISAYAFYGCGFSTLSIPEGVTSIGTAAFARAYMLNSISIPDSVTSISTSAFEGCERLSSIILPSGLTNISASAFAMTGLTEMTVKNDTPPVIGQYSIPEIIEKIYVPAQSVEAYKAAAGWSDFSEKIESIPEPTETNTNEQKPFDFGAWLHNAGEDVSAWISDNVGIATTGSTVLIIGGIILAVFVLRKRRR